MIKEFFGWLIAVCRRWAVGSSYDNKTSRARYGLSLICSFYILGVILNTSLFLTPIILKSTPKPVFMGLLILFIVAPILLLRKIYPKKVAELYIQKYQPVDLNHNVKQQLLAFSFCLIGWFVLGGPILIYNLFYI